MQDEVNTKVVAIMIKGGKISAEVLKKALDKFVQEIEIARDVHEIKKDYIRIIQGIEEAIEEESNEETMSLQDLLRILESATYRKIGRASCRERV